MFPWSVMPTAGWPSARRRGDDVADPRRTVEHRVLGVQVQVDERIRHSARKSWGSDGSSTGPGDRAVENHSVRFDATRSVRRFPYLPLSVAKGSGRQGVDVSGGEDGDLAGEADRAVGEALVDATLGQHEERVVVERGAESQRARGLAASRRSRPVAQPPVPRRPSPVRSGRPGRSTA